MKKVLTAMFAFMNLHLFDANYNGYYVDERYSGIVEPNLFGDNIFQPGATFNNQYQRDAQTGAIKIYKLDSSAVKKPGKPGSDFVNENTGNQLITLALNNSFDKSKKIYGVNANAVSYAAGEEHLSLAVRENQRDWNTSALACLANEGTDYGDYTVITPANIKDYIVDVRTADKNNFSNANVVMCRPEIYGAMLKAAGDDFTPMTNDEIVKSGRIGVWLGMMWVEANLMNNEQAAYFAHDDDENLVVVDLTDVDFIMYDWEAFNIVNSYTLLRIKDSENFPGSLAQNVITTGFRVPNPKRVLVKRNTLLDPLTVVSTGGAASGDTTLTVEPTILPDHTYVYKTDPTTAPEVTYDEVLTTGWTAWDGTSDISGLTNGHQITVAEIDGDNKAKKAGNTTLVVTA